MREKFYLIVTFLAFAAVQKRRAPAASGSSPAGSCPGSPDDSLRLDSSCAVPSSLRIAAGRTATAARRRRCR